MLNGTTYIVRPRIAPLNSAAVVAGLQQFAHLGRGHPVVGRSGLLAGRAADEGAVLDAGDVARAAAREIAVRAQLRVEPAKVPAATSCCTGGRIRRRCRRTNGHRRPRSARPSRPTQAIRRGMSDTGGWRLAPASRVGFIVASSSPEVKRSGIGQDQIARATCWACPSGLPHSDWHPDGCMPSAPAFRGGGAMDTRPPVTANPAECNGLVTPGSSAAFGAPPPKAGKGLARAEQAFWARARGGPASGIIEAMPRLLQCQCRPGRYPAGRGRRALGDRQARRFDGRGRGAGPLGLEGDEQADLRSTAAAVESGVCVSGRALSVLADGARPGRRGRGAIRCRRARSART